MKIKNKLLTGLIFASLSTSGFSYFKITEYKYKGDREYKQPVNPCPVRISFTGFYAGASLGADSNFFTTHDGPGNTIDMGEVSALAELFAGYGQMVGSNYYLGGEIYLNDTIGDATANTRTPDGGGTGTHIGAQTRESAGISFLPGLLVNDSTLGYARIGPVWTRYNTTVSSPTASNTNHNTKIGLELGLGLRTSMTENLDFRLGYSHTFYSAWTSTVNGYTFKTLGDRVNFGILYKFT